MSNRQRLLVLPKYQEDSQDQRQENFSLVSDLKDNVMDWYQVLVDEIETVLVLGLRFLVSVPMFILIFRSKDHSTT